MAEGRPKVAIIRVAERADAVMEALRDRGAEPVLVTSMVIAGPEDERPLRAAASDLSRYDAIILGSIAGAEAVVERASAQVFEGLVFCVGAQTRRRLDADPKLSRVLAGPRVVPADARAEGLEEAVRMSLSPLAGKRFLFPRPPEGRLTLVERLRDSGATIDAPDAYRIAPGPPLDDDARRGLEGVSAFLFFSGEAVRCFLETVPDPWGRRRLAESWVGVIGPAGADKARALGVRVDGVPESPGTEALLDLWTRYWRTKN